MQIDTAVGAAQVLHRLALGVEIIDAVTQRATSLPVRVGREMPTGAPAPKPWAPAWPCVDLDAGGGGRFKLRHNRPLPTGGGSIRVRIDDSARRYVPRRFAVALWDLADLGAGDPPAPNGVTPPAPLIYVEVRARLFRPWLRPGSAYPVPRGTTGIRGRVALADGTPVRWARVLAITPVNVPLGIAHCDERGEFLLVLTDTGTVPPAPSTIDVRLALFGRDPTAAPSPTPDPDDDLWDLPVEAVARSSNPPQPADLDNPLLRGRLVPPNYVGSVAPRLPHAVPVGEVLSAGDVTFDYP